MVLTFDGSSENVVLIQRKIGSDVQYIHNMRAVHVEQPFNKGTMACSLGLPIIMPLGHIDTHCTHWAILLGPWYEYQTVTLNTSRIFEEKKQIFI